jgi:AraC-like DNA-binding protein
MPSSTVRTFTDPDEFMTEAVMRTAIAELSITGPGDFAAKSIRIDLPRLWVARHTDNLPRVSHTVRRPGRANIIFRAKPGPSVLTSGVAMEPTNLIWTAEDHDAHQLSAGHSSLSTMSLSVEDMASVAATIVGCDLSPPRDTVGVTPPPHAMARLQRAHAAAVHLAETAPEIIANPDAAWGLEQVLIEAMVSCLTSGNPAAVRSAFRHHTKVMRRLEEVLRASPEGPLYMDDLCTAIGVSYRTLHACCREHLGMGPKRYLILRRMHLARRALSRGDPEKTSVTEIATDYGFWELGRFSVVYRSLFGESPLTTLRRLPGDPKSGAIAGATR